ncbi:30S ribosomal protein S2 [Arcticibacterium luteifluviistationis]|uniref:Small ribosomal subunit protein uS2 n=1 Tax=Arcticibacterium luteifluviistationis TaxID=1784714 RepID=A0A2Z4GG95_9BACT|nr:30S ribosomal protein S2 [Arcticibacterium luteifluviistationis]
MAQLTYKELLNAGVHFGHLTRKWDPRMAPYIFMEKNGIHIIDLNKSLASLDQASAFVKGIARSGRKIMFVATKKQAQEIVSEEAKRLKMPFVTERWLGGMLTNFPTIRKSLKKMQNIEKMLSDEKTAANLAKRERLMLDRDRIKLERLLGGVTDMSRLPAALFVVDIKREHLAISEAKRLGIPVIAMVDTNSNPELVEHAIPANDDAYKSVSLITLAIGKAIEEGIMERKQDKEAAELQEAEEAKKAADAKKEAAAEKAAAQKAVADAKAEEAAAVAPAEKAEAPAATEDDEAPKKKRTRTKKEVTAETPAEAPTESPKEEGDKA